jgi:trehalose 6-phosphate phosphatase
MTRRSLRAVVFDLDGVITRTARIHQAAWKRLFDGYLRERADESGDAFQPFEADDYLRYVDGRPRAEGIRTFLASRGVELPEGTDPGEEVATVASLGARKNAMFRELLDHEGADVDPEAVRLVRDLRAHGVRVGIASSSRNAERILRSAGLDRLFEARVDGEVSAERGLRGKPEPDIFLECLRDLGVDDPIEAVVVEDADVGVAAGRAGGFGLVIGIDGGGNERALLDAGADDVVGDFTGIDAAWLERRLRRVAGSRGNPGQRG